MREIRTYGSVRGARSNARPYRDRRKSARFAWLNRQGGAGCHRGFRLHSLRKAHGVEYGFLGAAR